MNVIVVSAIYPGVDWAKKIIYDTGQFITNYLHQKGVTTETLDNYLVRKLTLTNHLKRSDANLIVYIGHGLKSSWTGSHRLGYTIPSMGALVKNINDNLLSGRIVYSCSCKSLEELGPSAVDKGCVSFIGFDEECLVRYEDIDGDALNDFVDCLSVPVRMLINGYSVSDAIRAFKFGCLAYMSIADNRSEYYKAMERNCENIGFVGDGNATIINEEVHIGGI